MPNSEGERQRVEIALTPVQRSLPEQLVRLLSGLPDGETEIPFGLPLLSLELGRRLPEQAQTITFWQRGDVGRALRRAGFAVRVEYGKIVFVRRPPSSLSDTESGRTDRITDHGSRDRCALMVGEGRLLGAGAPREDTIDERAC